MSEQIGTHIRRKITTASEYFKSLTYLTDRYTNSIPSFHGTQDTLPLYKYDKTIALGNGSSYQYPRAMFLGSPNNQVYPPVIECQLCNINHIITNNVSNVKTVQMSIPDSFGYITPNNGSIPHTYIFPNVFHITYAKNFGTAYTNTNIPSFAQETQTGNKWAYFSGGTLSIGDSSNSFFGSSSFFPNPGISLDSDYASTTNLITHLELTANTNVTVDYLRSTYNISNLFAYNVFTVGSSKYNILRRSFKFGTGTSIISKDLSDMGTRTFYEMSRNVDIVVEHNYSNLSDYDARWKITPNANNTSFTCTDDSQFSICTDLPGVILNTFLIYRKDIDTGNEINMSSINTKLKIFQAQRLITDIPASKIINGDLSLNIRPTNDSHGDWFNGNPVQANLGESRLYIKVFTDKYGTLFNLSTTTKARKDALKPDISLSGNKPISFVYAERPEEIVALDIASDNFDVLSNRLCSLAYDVSDNILRLEIQYDDRYERALTSFSASGDLTNNHGRPPAHTFNLAANILLPFYSNGFLGFAKCLVISNGTFEATATSCNSSGLGSTSHYAIYFT